MKTPSVRVEAGASDESFTPTDVAEILAGLEDAQRRHDGLQGIIFHRAIPPMRRLAALLRDEVQALPLPEGCTGYYDEFALVTHDGDSCPVHELDAHGDGSRRGRPYPRR